MSADTPGRPPVPPADPDLSGAFNPRRSQGLKGKLVPRSQPTTASQQAHPAQAELPAQRVEVDELRAGEPPTEDEFKRSEASASARCSVSAEQTSGSPAQPKSRRSAESTGGKATRAVYVPGRIRTQLLERKRRTGRSYSVSVMDALDATHQRLPELLGVQDQSRSLFERQPPPSPPPTESGGVQITLSFTAANDKVINSLIEKTLGDVDRNRTRFITAALTAFLDQEPTD